MPNKVIATYGGKWGGVNTATTPFDIPPEFSQFQSNFIGRRGFLQPRWRFEQFLGPAPDGRPIKLVFHFKDLFGNYHTNAITDQNWYEIHGPVPYFYSQIGAVQLAGNIPSYVIYANAAYVTDNSVFGIYKWDGLGVVTEVTGGLFGGAYIFELAGSICIANTAELQVGTTGSHAFPYRIRWCVAGQDTEWDPNNFRGAGFIDMLDCPDDITGVMQMGTIAYILRTNGLSQMIPTGVGDSAFSLSHMWASDVGTGELYPYLSASFGSIGFIVSKEDIYSITISSLNPIGGVAKYAIYSDLITTTDIAFGQMVGFITQKQSYGNVYPVYQMLFQVNTSPPFNMVGWSYALDDKAWVRSFYSNHYLTGRPNFVYMPTA